MVWGIFSETDLPKGTRPPGTPLSTPLTGTIKIACIGDSITVGNNGGDDTGDGWRTPLGQRLTALGHTIQFVGSYTNGTAPYNKHNGIVGSDCDEHLTFGTAGIVAALSPHVCTVYLGTNDANDDPEVFTGSSGKYLTFMRALLAAMPSVRFVAFKISKSGAVGSVMRTNIAAFNAWLPSAIATLTGEGMLVTLGDFDVLTHPEDFLRTETLPSAVHPGTGNGGYTKMADAAVGPVLNAMGYAAQW